jgi:hypothetical protein
MRGDARERSNRRRWAAAVTTDEMRVRRCNEEEDGKKNQLPQRTWGFDEKNKKTEVPGEGGGGQEPGGVRTTEGGAWPLSQRLARVLNIILYPGYRIYTLGVESYSTPNSN